MLYYCWKVNLRKDGAAMTYKDRNSIKFMIVTLIASMGDIRRFRYETS